MFLNFPLMMKCATRLKHIIKSHCNEIAGVIVEPLVQGAGGLKFHDEECLRFMREGNNAPRRASDFR